MVTKDSYLVAIKPRHETGETRREEHGKQGFFHHAVFGASGATRSIRTILTPWNEAAAEVPGQVNHGFR
jgi:hypothetical protein